MSSSKQTKFSGTKAKRRKYSCTLSSGIFAAFGTSDWKYAGGRRNVSGDRKYFHWNFICGSGTWRSLSDL